MHQINAKTLAKGCAAVGLSLITLSAQSRSSTTTFAGSYSFETDDLELAELPDRAVTVYGQAEVEFTLQAFGGKSGSVDLGCLMTQIRSFDGRGQRLSSEPSILSSQTLSTHSALIRLTLEENQADGEYAVLCHAESGTQRVEKSFVLRVESD